MGWNELAHGRHETREAPKADTSKDNILGAKVIIARDSKAKGGAIRGEYKLLFTVPLNGTPFAFYNAGDYKGVAMIAYGPVGQWIGRAKHTSFASLTTLLDGADAILDGLAAAVSAHK